MKTMIRGKTEKGANVAIDDTKRQLKELMDLKNELSSKQRGQVPVVSSTLANRVKNQMRSVIKDI